MAYYPISTEIGGIYTLVSPSGERAVFNDQADADYVGMLPGPEGITGLDSAEVRESAFDRVEGDGGYHGKFYFSRRPIVINAKVFNHASIAQRTARVDKARQASLCLGADGALTWKPSNWATTSYLELYVPVRRQQPFRETGGWVKDLQIPLVSEHAVIFSNTLITSASTAAGTGVVLENRGNYAAYPILEISGVSGSTTTITDGNGGTYKSLSSLTIASGEKVEVDTLNHTAVFTAGARNGQNATRYIDFSSITQWPALAKGNNTFTLASGAGGTLRVKYRHTWA